MMNSRVDRRLVATALRQLADQIERGMADVNSIEVNMGAGMHTTSKINVVSYTDQPWWAWDATNALPEGVTS